MFLTKFMSFVIDGRTTVVPLHTNKSVSRGLIKAILHEIQMERKEFFAKFKK